MRLFVGVDVGDAVRALAATAMAELRRKAAALAPSARITWVAADRLHLTLRFIGQVDAARVEAVTTALREPIELARFSIVWEGLGTFPSAGPPRVLWVAAADGGAAVAALEKQVSRRLRRAGIPPESRGYNAHLTLARVREPHGLRTAALLEGMHVRLGATMVDAITLYESRLSPKGPDHLVVQRTALRGDAPATA